MCRNNSQIKIIATFQVFCFVLHFHCYCAINSFLLRNTAKNRKLSKKPEMCAITFIFPLFLHIMSEFPVKSIKTHGGERKNLFLRKMHFCEKWQFFAKMLKISLNLAKNWIFAILYYPFHGFYYFSDFQHHWHDFSKIMTQKVQKLTRFGPQIS